MTGVVSVVSVVNVAAAGVVAPITVPLIPVVVTLKFADVNNVLLAPAFIVYPVSPVRFTNPDVPLKLSAPVVRVNPFEAVNKAFEVIAPVPVVVIFPLVVRLPVSEIVRVAEPEDCDSNTF